MPDESASFLASLVLHVLFVLILALISTSINVGLRPLLLLNADGESLVETLGFEPFEASSLNTEQDQVASVEQTVETIDLAVAEPSLSLAEVVPSASTADSIPKTWVPSELMSTVGTSNSPQPAANASNLFAASSLEGRSLENRRRQNLHSFASWVPDIHINKAIIET